MPSETNGAADPNAAPGNPHPTDRSREPWPPSGVESGPGPILGGASLAWIPAANLKLDPFPGAPVFSANLSGQAFSAAAAGQSLYSQRQFAASLQRYLDAVRLDPTNARYHFGLALAAEKLERHDLTEHHFLEAVRLDPAFALAHNSLSIWYLTVSRLDRASYHSAAALALEPTNAAFVAQRGKLLLQEGDSEAAWDLIRPLIEGGSTNRWLADFYAFLASSLGRDHQQRAVDVVLRALEQPGLSPAHDGKPLLHFAAANLLDRLGRFDEAFTQARLANESIRSISRPYDPGDHSRWIDRKIRYFTPERLRSLHRATHGNHRPVFIVGLPRSGSTLVEQILASHPAVFPGGELRDLPRIARNAPSLPWGQRQPYPQCLEWLSSSQADALAAPYLAMIESLNPDATYVTDKMPHNFAHLDWAELLFPGCHVIYCLRDPRDTCLSCYMTGFAGGNAFKYDLTGLGSFYRDYRRAMDHWQKVLTLPSLEVQYEDIVLDLEGQARRMLDFLGLPWDDRCLRFHERRRRVNTNSEQQIRRPLYRSSVGRWKNYERHLDELFTALGTPSPNDPSSPLTP